MRVNQPAESNDDDDLIDLLPPGWSRTRYITREQAQIEYPTHVDERTTVDLCDEYLSTLHTGAWGRMFYITSDDDRRTAATWLALQIEGVMRNVKGRSEAGSE